MTLAPGTRLGHYEIGAPLGAGGMGEVYRATDAKLGRQVALKVLPKDMARDADRLSRFQREARAVAALNHPHIVTLHSVEEADGVHFLTMELVEGQSLDQVIPTGGLPVGRLLAIASALADALVAAHERGLVHRDLKPANVMLTDDGRVKVLDFGLAKDLRASDAFEATMTSGEHTQAGVVMGTPAYMSPEQVAGRLVDHRTDLFSLCVILYQMASGCRPFEGATSMELGSAILRETPRALTEVRPDLPADLVRVIRRCLEKDPRDRIQTARDVGNELREIVRTVTPPRGTTPPPPIAASGSSVIADEGFRVAVLPFRPLGSHPDLQALAEGLSDEIVTGLSRFPYLRVVARGAGGASGARYVMEGTLRQSGAKLRVATQLVDTATGTHLWAENYERPFNPDAVFELQDDLVPRIVSTVADMNGVLTRSMTSTVRGRRPEDLTAYEAVLRSFGYFERLTTDELVAARTALESALKRAPDYADAWAMLALLSVQDYSQGFGLQADPLASGARAARKAVDAATSNPLAWFSLAQALFFERDREGFRHAAERAAMLNPMDGNSIAFIGELLTYAGYTERGLELAGRAKQLNPHHPGWFWFADYFHAYAQRDYHRALAIALKVNMPAHWGANVALAAAAGQVGNREIGERAVRNLVALRPHAATGLRKDFDKWWDAAFVEDLIAGLRKAGLDVAPRAEASVSTPTARSPRSRDSGAAPALEGFRIAVLPFRFTGTNADLASLAEGLSEEIVTGLSRFSYLRVAARSATARYANLAVDARAVATDLGVRYIVEGSVRQSGAALRLAVQLVDTDPGEPLWAETYTRPFEPASLFEIQDDLVPRIVATIADPSGVLIRSLSDALRARPADALTPYEAFILALGFQERITKDEHLRLRASLERAVEQAPDYADAWAALADLGYVSEFKQAFNLRPDPLGRALVAARRAVELAPANHRTYQALASVFFFRGDIPAFRRAAERSLELNLLDTSGTAYLGALLAFAGEWDRGCALIDRAIQLKGPVHPGWLWLPACWRAYGERDYATALDAAVKVNMPGYPFSWAALAAVYGQLGDRVAAGDALEQLLKLRPDFAQAARGEFSKWFVSSELVEHVLDGLRKAGLDVARM